MTASGNTTFSMTASEIITMALKLKGVIGPGEAVQQEDYNDMLVLLNLMIKLWQAPSFGLHYWLQDEYTLYLTPGQQFYKIGGSSSDRISGSDNSTITTISSDAASSATTLTVTSTAHMHVSDNIGITLDNGTIFWTTITNIPTSTSVQITSGLTSTAATGQMVYVYTSLSGRLRDIENVRLLRSGTTSLLMHDLSKSEYFKIPNLTTDATPVQYMIDRKADHTRIYVYGTASTAQDCIQFTGSRVIQDYTLSSNTSDLPQEWLHPIVYNLPIYAASVYGKEFKISAGLRQLAAESLEALRSYDQEEAPFYFQPNMGDML